MQSNVRLVFFLGLLLGVLYLAIQIFMPYFITLSLAATAAIVFHSLYRRTVGVCRGRERIAALIMVVFTFVILLLPLTFIGVHIVRQALDVYAQLTGDPTSIVNDMLSTVELYLQRFMPGMELNLQQYVGQGLRWLASSVGSLLAGTLNTVLHLFLGMIAYYYMLKDGPKFLNAVVELSPLNNEDDEEILLRLRRAVDSVIRGSLIIAILQGTATGVGFAIFGVGNAVLFGAVAGVGALVPGIGTGIVIVPAVVYLFVRGDMGMAIGLSIWGATAVGLIDTFLHPLLVGRGMRLHPFFILFAVIGGITVFGLVGFILGPLVLSLLFGLLEIFRKEMRPTSRSPLR
jgi:predicted PurR-regulated permease PerM